MDKFLAPEPLKDGPDLPEQWKKFKRDFDLFLRATNKHNKSDALRIALLLRTIGDRGNDLFEAFRWEEEDHKHDFARVLAKFDTECRLRVNTIATTHKLLTSKQAGKSIDEFVTELHNIARYCNFGEMYDRMVLQALILGVENDKIRRRIFEEPDITLDNAVRICRAKEDAARDLSQINESVSAVYLTSKAKPNRHGEARATRRHQSQQDYHHEGAGKPPCPRCGHQHPPRSCPAFGKVCRNCGGKNHWAKVCRSTKAGEPVRVHQATEWNYSSSSEEEFTNHLTVHNKDRKLMTEMLVHTDDEKKQHKITFQLDTGATANILTRRDFNRIKPTMSESTKKITLYDGSTQKPAGECKLTTVDNAGKNRSLRFLVIESEQPSLLSATTCLELGLIQANETVHFTTETQTEGDTRKPQQKKEDPKLDAMIEEFNDVFSGLGKLAGEVKIQLKEDHRPIQVRPRKMPLSMKADVMKKLEEYEAQGIIQTVQHPTDWISHLQPVRKANGEIRPCIDPQNLNRAIRRNHLALPTLEDVLPELNKARYFSLCDAANGFLQVTLDKESTDLTTFWAPDGTRKKFLRLPFGLTSSGEEFQRKLSETLQGLTGVIVVADDILVYGTDRPEHDENLRKLLQRARESNLKLNQKKCKFLQTEVAYIGHLLTGQGVKPDPRKVSAISEMKPPTNKDGIKRFLGHITYMTKFMPCLAAKSEPLRKILKESAEFTWGEQEQKAFEELKNMLTSAETLQYFDAKKPIIVQTDASAAGLGAALIQDGKPVTYISRSLAPAEKNYVPIELEMLAIVYAMEKLDQYVFGHPDVTIHTDHRPLEAIAKKPMHKASKRLQAMLLAMQRYAGAHILWKPGRKQLTADLLSRDANMDPPAKKEARHHLFRIEDMPLGSAWYEEIREVTANDNDLQTLTQWITGNAALPSHLRKYQTFRDELSAADGLVLRGDRVIIPAALRRVFLERLHQAHQGINSTLRRARQSIYWPTMAEEIKAVISSCRTCARDSPMQQREPILNHERPAEPWTKLGADLLKMNGNNYLVITDYGSDFFEFAKLRTEKSEDVIEAMKTILARWGIPKILHSDNGTQFTSAAFRKFTKEWMFAHSTSSPYYPKSNGKAEATVKIVKRLLKRCEDPQLALLIYRNTPTEGMETSPMQRLIGRATQANLPLPTPTPGKDPADKQARLQKTIRTTRAYNSRAKERAELQEGQPVWLRDVEQQKATWREAKVERQLSSRSYLVHDGESIYRRNSRDLRPRAEEPRADPEPPTEARTPRADEAEPPTEDNQAAQLANVPLRRTRKPPKYLEDYVC